MQESVQDKPLPEMKDYIDVLHRYCLTLTRSEWESEDLAQEACLRTLSVLTGRCAHPNPVALLIRTAKNIWIDRLRRGQIAARVEQQLIIAGDVTHHDEYSYGTDSILNSLARSLSPLQLTVFLLRDVFEFSAAETAVRLRTTEGAIKAALHRARRGIARIKAALVQDRKIGSRVEAWLDDDLQAYKNAFLASNPDALVFLTLAQEEMLSPVEAVSHMHVRGQNKAAQGIGSAAPVFLPPQASGVLSGWVA